MTHSGHKPTLYRGLKDTDCHTVLIRIAGIYISLKYVMVYFKYIGFLTMLSIIIDHVVNEY